MPTSRSSQQNSRKSAGVLLSVKKEITKYILPRSRRLNLADHLGPALGRDRPELHLHHPEREGLQARLLDLPPMGIGVEAVIANCHLPLVGNMGGDPGNELEVVPPLHLAGLFAITVADLTFPFIEGEAFQGKKRPDHILAHPLGLALSLSSHQAMDRETRVPPGKQPFRPFRAEKLLPNEERQDLPGEELSQPRVIDQSDLVEGTRLIHSSLGHQEMKVGVKVNPVAKCLDGGNHSGHQLAVG